MARLDNIRRGIWYCCYLLFLALSALVVYVLVRAQLISGLQDGDLHRVVPVYKGPMPQYLGTFPDAPLAWSTAGGGWRATAAAAGFSRAFHRAGVLDSEHFLHLAGNSGGSWFLSLFSFSRSWYRIVLGGGSLEDIVVRAMELQREITDLERNRHALDPATLRTWIRSQPMRDTLTMVEDVLLAVREDVVLKSLLCSNLLSWDANEAIGELECSRSIDELTAGFFVAAQTQGSWGVFMKRAMQLATPVSDGPGFDVGSVRAVPSQRHGYTRHMLHYHMSNLTEFEVDGRRSAWAAAENRQPSIYDVLPLAFLVPGEADAGPDGRVEDWPASRLDAVTRSPTAVPGAPGSPRWYASELVSRLGAHTSWVAPGADGPEYDPPELMVDGEAPPVWLVTSMSSAAPAFLSSVNMTARVAAFAFGTSPAPLVLSPGDPGYDAQAEVQAIAALEGEKDAPPHHEEFEADTIDHAGRDVLALDRVLSALLKMNGSDSGESFARASATGGEASIASGPGPATNGSSEGSGGPDLGGAGRAFTPLGEDDTMSNLVISEECRAVLNRDRCAAIRLNERSRVTWAKAAWALVTNAPNMIGCAMDILSTCQSSLLGVFQDMAVCDNATLPTAYNARHCEFGRRRVADGVFTDNTAASTTIAVMQRKYPGKPLRMIITTNSECTHAELDEGSRPCSLSAHDFSLLFAGADRPPPGAPTNTLAPFVGPNPLVFAEDYANIAWSRVPGTRYVSSAHVTTETVANPLVGTTAGQPVELLLLALDGPIRLTIGGTDNTREIARLGEYAEDASHEHVALLVYEWLNGKAFNASVDAFVPPLETGGASLV